MKSYIFQAALLCEHCGDELIASLELDPVRNSGPREDSDDWPQGPYGDGGGEADTPQHCDACRVFLENPLTGEGYAYVKDALLDHLENGRGNKDVLLEWIEFYCNEDGELDLVISLFNETV